MHEKSDFQPAPICKKCGGSCCKNMPGIVLPDDITLDKKTILEMVTSNYCFDWWEGDPRSGKNRLNRAYYIRPRIKGDDGIFSPAWHGECIFLSDNGCALAHNEKPYQCRAVKPSDNKECFAPEDATKRAAAVAWLEHSRLLKAVIKMLK